MAIPGLTDRTPSFKEIGRLRLGIPKEFAKTQGPREIAFFRADFRPDAQDAAAAFKEIYGDEPTAINFRLPFTEINRCWDAFYEVYNTSGMLGMADGVNWLYLRDQKGKLLVKDGLPLTPFDKNVPVYSYKNKRSEDVPVFAKPTGKLRILVPELKRAAYVVIVTHSVYNIMKISEQLAGVQSLAANIGLTLPMIPLVITRRPETISVAIDGKKSMQQKYLLNIEIDPAWMGAQFKLLNSLLPGAPMPLPALPSGQTFTQEELSEDEPVVEDEQFVVDPNASVAENYQDNGGVVTMELEVAANFYDNYLKKTYGNMQPEELVERRAVILRLAKQMNENQRKEADDRLRALDLLISRNVPPEPEFPPEGV